MTETEEIEILNKLANVATLAGLKGGVDPEGPSFDMVFGLGDGRSQGVRIIVSGRGAESGPILTVFSPALKKKKGLLGGFSANLMLTLLKRNHEIPFARFAVIERSDDYLLVANQDLLADTVDPAELNASCWQVAKAADDVEREFGKGDDY
jgi:hypothetical protein